MTKYILNGQKGDFDWNHNKEYKTCPYCGSSCDHGGKGFNDWNRVYNCGSIITAEWSNDGYTVNYDIKCDTPEGIYSNIEVSGRVFASVHHNYNYK